MPRLPYHGAPVVSAVDTLVVGWVTRETVEKLRQDPDSFYAVWASARGSIDQPLVPASALEASEAKIAALEAENGALREKVERAAEDERDRLRVLSLRQGAYDAECFLIRHDALLPADRAALSQAEEKSDG